MDGGSPNKSRYEPGFNYHEEGEPLVDVPVRNGAPFIPTIDEIRVVQPFNRGPLRGLDFSGGLRPWDIMRQLIANLPLNDYKLPIHIYRVDLLDFVRLSQLLQSFATTTTVSFPPEQGGIGNGRNQIMQEVAGIVEAAQITLAYDEGYPALPEGTPFWQQLPFESDEQFAMFVEYLALDGVRMLSELKTYPVGITRPNFFMNYWQLRVKAYELYKVASAHRKRMSRLLNVDDAHFADAEVIMGKLKSYFAGMTLDNDSITPDKAVAMFEKVVKVQRVAAGLNANGEKEGMEPGKVASVSVTMQQIVQKSEGDKSGNEAEKVDILNDHPDLLEKAQDLILSASEVTDLE